MYGGFIISVFSNFLGFLSLFFHVFIMFVYISLFFKLLPRFLYSLNISTLIFFYFYFFSLLFSFLFFFFVSTFGYSWKFLHINLFSVKPPYSRTNTMIYMHNLWLNITICAWLVRWRYVLFFIQSSKSKFTFINCQCRLVENITSVYK